MSPHPPPRRVARMVGCLAAIAAFAGCTTSAGDPAESTTTPVPTSAEVSVPPGPAVRTDPGAMRVFGLPAVLPANAFAASGPLAMFTVTGITRGDDVPDATTAGGVPYFVYVTVTSLADRPSPPPDVLGLAGSTDGQTAALTIEPPPGVDGCRSVEPPERMQRGESYATCLIALADPEQELSRVIYWADTGPDAAYDYKSAPVVWHSSLPAPSESEPSESAPVG